MNEIAHIAHTWTVESHHRTSEGTVVYRRCACGARSVELVRPEYPGVWFGRPDPRTATVPVAEAG